MRGLSKRHLVATLEQAKGFDQATAKLHLEQYPTDAGAAVELAYIAGFMHGDVKGRVVLDLGTGTGRLAIAMLFFGAATAIGIEIDDDAARLAVENAVAFGFHDALHVIQADVMDLATLVRGTTVDGCTIVMNPPFGIQGPRGADMRFLETAMAFPPAGTIYSMHLSADRSRDHITARIAAAGWITSEVHQVPVILPRLYDFHVEKRKEIQVDVYRLVRQGPTGSTGSP